MATRTVTQSEQGRARHWLAALLIAVPLAACSGKDWPRLVDVQRPKESQTYTVPAPEAATDVAADNEQTSRPPPTDAALPLDKAALDAASARLDLALAGLTTAEDQYAAALYAFLVSSSGDQAAEDRAELWSVAQYRLTRLGAAVGELAAVNRELSALGLGAMPDSPQDLTVALGREMARTDAAYKGWPEALLLENNRLAALTPPEMGAPGPQVLKVGQRSPYIRIDLGNPGAAFARDLEGPVKRALQVAPDLRFDLISVGPDRNTAQANLRRVTAVLLDIGVPRAQLVVGLDTGSGAQGFGEALIYLHKRSR